MTRPLLWLLAGFVLLAVMVALVAPPRLRTVSLLLPLGAAVPVAVVLGGIALVRRGREGGDDGSRGEPGGIDRG